MQSFTRLERTVLTALAAELRDAVPDLARQFAASRPSRRLNTGFGLFTHVAVQAPAPLAGPTGDFGTVHAMVGPLRDPIAFTARLQDGRLIGLVGDSYNQDTRSLDFATVPFDQVFTVDPSGRSIPVQIAPSATPHAAPAPRRAATQPSPTAPVEVRSPSPSVRRPDIAATFEAARPTSAPLKSTPAPAPTPASDAAPIDRVSLLIGAWTMIGVVAVLAVLLFDVPWPFALIAAFWLSAALRRPKARDALQRGVAEYQKARAAQRG